MIPGTTRPADMLTKPKRIDDERARLACVGVSINWENKPHAIFAQNSCVLGGPTQRVRPWEKEREGGVLV